MRDNMRRETRPSSAQAAAAEVADLERASQVRLRPFLGLPPGTYLTVIYGLIVLLALFLVLIYPGLRSPGGRIAVTATPRHVTVWLDGTFAGTTPLSLQAAPGTHDLELTRAGFAAVRLQVEVAPRVLGTLIVRNRATAHADLELTDGTGVARRGVAEFAGAWHATGIIEEAGRALAGAAPADQYAFLRDTVPFIDRRQALGALVRASATSAAGGGPVTPQTVRSLFDRFLRLDRDYPGLSGWLALSVPDELRDRLTAQRWYVEHREGYGRGLATRPEPARPGALPDAVVVGGVRFRSVPRGTLLMGDDVDRPLLADTAHDHQPHLRAVEPFLMAETEVTNRQFARFVAAVPRWSPGATDELVSAGLAEPSYLASWADGVPAPGTIDQPVTHVSYHAAAAFAAWLGAVSASAGWPYGDSIVRLPTEAEWEWAARGGLTGQPYPSGSGPGGARLAGSRVNGARVPGPGPAPASEPNGYGLYDLLGNVWEWTATWYAPTSYLLWAGADPAAAIAGQPRAGAERVVRGGSWASERDLIRVYLRGAQEPAWATPFLGFRVVIAAPDAPDG
jgi:formylglycine-generating enzyme required for sulfatase activity